MSNRPKNYAPKEMVGRYYLTIEGNSVEIVSRDGTMRETVIKCHPDDTFDIGEAVRIGMNRLNVDNIIRIGDIVKVVDGGSSYSTVFNWDDVDKKYIIRYRYGVCPTNGTIGKVVKILDDKYIIEVKKENYLGNSKFNHLYYYDCIYVMDKHGLEKIKDGRYE